MISVIGSLRDVLYIYISVGRALLHIWIIYVIVLEVELFSLGYSRPEM